MVRIQHRINTSIASAYRLCKMLVAVALLALLVLVPGGQSAPSWGNLGKPDSRLREKSQHFSSLANMNKRPDFAGAELRTPKADQNSGDDRHGFGGLVNFERIWKALQAIKDNDGDIKSVLGEMPGKQRGQRGDREQDGRPDRPYRPETDGTVEKGRPKPWNWFLGQRRKNKEGGPRRDSQNSQNRQPGQQRSFKGKDDERGKRPFKGGDDELGKRPFKGGDDKPGRRPFKDEDDEPGKRPFKGGDDKPGRRPFKDEDDEPGKRPFKGGDHKPGRRPFKGGDDKPGRQRQFKEEGNDDGQEKNPGPPAQA